MRQNRTKAVTRGQKPKAQGKRQKAKGMVLGQTGILMDPGVGGELRWGLRQGSNMVRQLGILKFLD